MKNFFKKTIMVLAVLISLILVYYTIVVLKARYDTPQIVNAIKQSDQLTLKLTDLSKRQIDILIQVQDPGFYTHSGIDLSSPGAGLTTITQALVKKLYFDNFKPGIAKIKQSLIAYFALDPMVSKNEQLEMFINIMYFGVNVKGLANAAQFYYQKPIKQLTEDEYISLIAMLVSPKIFCLKRKPKLNAERVRRIKLLISGQYKPKGLMDQYYGKLSSEVQEKLPPASYFEYE